MDKTRILIVDDDSSVCRILVRTFEQNGFEVQAVANGEQALAKLGEAHFDVMISDIQMPRMDGRQLCEHLANDGPYLPELTLIMTSRSESEMRDWVSAYPGISIIEKPIGPRQLVRAVKERLAAGVLVGAP